MSTSQWKDPRDLTTLPAFIQKRKQLPRLDVQYLIHPCSRTPAATEAHQKGRNTLHHHPLALWHPLRRRRP